MLTEPFIDAVGPLPHLEDYWTEQGIQLVEQVGAHALFAARVPFIPSLLGADFTRMVGGNTSRAGLIQSRQMRFITDLAPAKDNGATLELRFMSEPGARANENGRISLVVVGKTFNENRRQAIVAAEQLWAKLRTHFPSEDPFNYPLEPVGQDDLHGAIHPFDWDRIGTDQIIEIRKYEDRDPRLPVTDIRGYFPHPFSPVFHFSAMGRFLETLAKQRQRCVVCISIRPTALFPGELVTINQMLNSYDSILKESESWLALFRAERMGDVTRTYAPLISQRNHLFLLKAQVVGELHAPEEVVEALASEFMDNETDEPRLWSKVRPGSQNDLAQARTNLALLEQRNWGQEAGDPRISRLRSLATAHETAGAFRLPIPPESGYLPGLLVRDEPFVMPTDEESQGDQRVSLGEIIHRGKPTGVQFELSARDLTRHGLVAGSTGSGKTNTCLHLLSQLWKRYRIPFLVMYPIDKPDYRLLMADPDLAKDLLIFTLGDEGTSPFRFNPFAVDDGVLLKTHLSLLLRCFSAAFALWDPLPAVFREALREVYTNAGWDVLRGRGGAGSPPPPTMGEFHTTIIAVAERMTRDYGAEVRGNVRTGAIIRIGDLVQNLGAVVNVRQGGPLDEILAVPTVFELARAGSSEDVALLMGFLLMSLSQRVQARFRQAPRSERHGLHLMLIEEAHRLMAAGDKGSEHQSDPRAKGAEDFSNILAEVRGFNEGLLIAEQIPTALVNGAIANTHFKLMHWLEDTASFRLFCEIMNLDERQRTYARTLRTGEAIVRSASGQPIHVRIGNYLDGLQTETDTAIVDDSDAAVAAFMHGRVNLPNAEQVPDSLMDHVSARTAAPQGKWGRPCASCTVVCAHGERIAALPSRVIQQDAPTFGQLARAHDNGAIKNLVVTRLAEEQLPPDATVGYCYLARIAAGRTKDGATNFERYDFVAQALADYQIETGLNEVESPTAPVK
jgi:hypothetical protein